MGNCLLPGARRTAGPAGPMFITTRRHVRRRSSTPCRPAGAGHSVHRGNAVLRERLDPERALATTGLDGSPVPGHDAVAFRSRSRRRRRGSGIAAPRPTDRDQRRGRRHATACHRPAAANDPRHHDPSHRAARGAQPTAKRLRRVATVVDPGRQVVECDAGPRDGAVVPRAIHPVRVRRAAPALRLSRRLADGVGAVRHARGLPAVFLRERPPGTARRGLRVQDPAGKRRSGRIVLSLRRVPHVVAAGGDRAAAEDRLRRAFDNRRGPGRSVGLRVAARHPGPGRGLRLLSGGAVHVGGRRRIDGLDRRQQRCPGGRAGWS